MQHVKWLAALYIDDRATPSRFAALEAIYTGKAGGHPSVLVGFFDRFLGVKSAPISYEAESDERSLHIPEHVTAEIKAIAG
jgi:hypothetical protein